MGCGVELTCASTMGAPPRRQMRRLRLPPTVMCLRDERPASGSLTPVLCCEARARTAHCACTPTLNCAVRHVCAAPLPPFIRRRRLRARTWCCPGRSSATRRAAGRPYGRHCWIGCRGGGRGLHKERVAGRQGWATRVECDGLRGGAFTVQAATWTVVPSVAFVPGI